MLKKMTTLFRRGKKSQGLGSVFSQKMQQSGYKAKQLNTGPRKKSLRERWLAAKNNNGRKNGTISGRAEAGSIYFSVKLVLLAGVLLFGCGWLLTGPMQSLYDDFRYFRIHEIEISGCRITSSDELRNYAGLSYEMNMMTLDPAAIRMRLQDHPWVKTATVKRIWPDELTVTIKEYRPQAIVVQDEGTELSYVNSGGTVFAAVSPGQELDLPVITGLGGIPTEEGKQKMLAAASLFLRLAARNNPNLPAQDISEVHFTEGGELILYLVEHPFPIYFGQDEVKRKYSQLRQVLEVLYRKKMGRAGIENVAYIRMDYQKNKVLVVRNRAS